MRPNERLTGERRGGVGPRKGVTVQIRLQDRERIMVKFNLDFLWLKMKMV